MRVEYDNDIKTLVALHRRVLKSTAIGRKMLLHRHLIVQAVLVVVCGLFAVSNDPFKVMAVFVVLSALAWVLRDRVVVKKYKKDLKGNMPKGPDGTARVRRAMTVREYGLEFESEGQTRLYAWSDLEAVEADAKNVYVMPYGLLHYVLPLSAFGPGQYEEFMNTLKSNMA